MYYNVEITFFLYSFSFTLALLQFAVNHSHVVYVRVISTQATKAKFLLKLPCFNYLHLTHCVKYKLNLSVVLDVCKQTTVVRDPSAKSHSFTWDRLTGKTFWAISTFGGVLERREVWIFFVVAF